MSPRFGLTRFFAKKSTRIEKATMAANRTAVKATGSISRHAILNRVKVEAHIRATDRRARSISRGAGAVLLCSGSRVVVIERNNVTALRPIPRGAEMTGIPMERGQFETRVRRVILGLRPGEVATYGEVAEEAGFPGAARAVGNVLSGSE